jgi:hypothetical protein
MTMKSAIYLQQEKPSDYPTDNLSTFDTEGITYHAAPFTLSYDDNAQPRNQLENRMRVSLKRNNRVYRYTDWPLRTVVYRKL